MGMLIEKIVFYSLQKNRTEKEKKNQTQKMLEAIEIVVGLEVTKMFVHVKKSSKYLKGCLMSC